MPTLHSFVTAAVLAALPLALVGCVIEESPPRRLAPEPAPYEPVPDDGAPSPPSTTSSPSPMLVVIDTDQTMTADPGEGVGVFVEYASGGHWNVWWTCDTARTGQVCEFNVSAEAATGTVSDVDATGLAGGYVTTPIPSRVEARVQTANEVHGVRFSTEPGAVITLQASVGGLKDGSFLFFVQDGKVNGGFAGRLTNPLQLQGTTP
jgi:hypothetical protein